MARILRRRVAQMPKVASGRRNLASEINQYLKLGLNAQQIIEKMIPDDPSVTPEMMGPIFDMMALRQGATAPLAQRAAGVQQIAGGMMGQPPAIPVGQPSSEVATLSSQDVAASPAPSPGAAVPPKSEFFPTLGVDPEQQKFSDDFRSVRRSSMPTGEKIRFAATPGTSPEARREMVQQIALDIFGGAGRPTPERGFDGAITANTPEDAMAQAEALVERAEMAQLEEQGSAEMQSGLQAMARAESQAKAEVSQSIQEAQIAENAAQLKSSFRQMFNAIREGSGMYDFAGNVEKAVPLFLRAAQASKASSDDIQLFKLFAQKTIREGEATARGAEFDRQLKARTAENNRRFKRAQGWWREQRTSLTAEKRATFDDGLRRDIFKTILAAKDGDFSTPVKRAIEGQIKARKVFAGESAKLDEIKEGFPGGEEGLKEAAGAFAESGRVPSMYEAAWPLYQAVLVNLAGAKGEMDAQEKVIQEYAESTGNFIPPLAPLGAKTSSGKEVGPKPEQGSAVVNKARQAMLKAGMSKERVDSILGRRNFSTEEASNIAGDQFKKK